jgi:hypothetical protein
LKGLSYLIFTLFKDRRFEVAEPEALIEAYCFQSDFYSKYDLERPDGDERYKRVRFIGARIEKNIVDKCRILISQYGDLSVIDEKGLDWLLKKATIKERDRFISMLSELSHKLDKIPLVGLSRATKILHSRYPEVVPMVDNPLQREYKRLRPEWRKGDWHQMLFRNYYDNLLEKATSDNLQELHERLSHLNLTKVRIFDILWWSFLKSKDQEHKDIKWKTIRQLE